MPAIGPRFAAICLTLVVLSGLAAAPAVSAAATTSSTATTPSSVVTATTTSTAQTMGAEIIGWLNRDRVAKGLRPLRAWPALASLAGTRAGRMAATGTLSHAAAGGNVGTALTSAGIRWYGFGEIIGTSGYPWGSQAAANLYSMWKNSPTHHAIMFSASYNYVGAGIVRASNGSTWASIVFTESVDHTRPVARNGALTAVGTTVRFGWSGYDPLLQTHTAGLRGFNVQYRVDSGAWHLIRNLTTSTSLGLSGRAHRHYYSFRVQAADRRGNLSAWTAAKRIWVP